jgi:hypothetical protein
MVGVLAVPLIVGQLVGLFFALLQGLRKGLHTVAGTWTESTVKEIADPLRFVVGAIVMFSRKRDSAAWFRLVAGVLVLLAAASIPYIGGEVTGVFNPLLYAISVFVAGTIALVPDRIGDLREGRRLGEGGRLGGHRYPVKLKAGFGVAEYLVLIIAIILIIVWGYAGRHPHNPDYAGIAWGVGSAAALDLFTLSACIILGGSGLIVEPVREALAAGRDQVAKAAAGQSTYGRGPSRGTVGFWTFVLRAHPDLNGPPDNEPIEVDEV